MTTVVGTDNQPPIENASGRWTTWSMAEIYLGEEGLNKYIPKVNDYVRVPETYVTYIVDYVDPQTKIPTLRRIRPEGYEEVFSDQERLFGTGRHPMETYRVYINKSTALFELTVDIAATVTGTIARYAKILKDRGDGTLEVISRMYDNNNNFVSENVPLEIAAVKDVQQNISIRCVSPCKTTQNLVSGDYVFVDIYSDAGVLLHRRELVVEETTFVRALSASTKYITGIRLETPFISETNDHLIEFPLNLNLGSMVFFGVVHYSDGTTLRLPVDNGRFQLEGLDQFISSIPEQRLPLMLKYNMSTSESALTGTTIDGRAIVETYDLQVIAANKSYAVKLFGYPVWQSLASGYRMEWWLYNLDRNISYNVTDLVRFENSHGAFNPLLYGVVQQKNVSINLRDISQAFKNFIHVQRVDITLMGPVADTDPSWFVKNEIKSSMVEFGHNAKAFKTGTLTVNLNNDQVDLDAWLDVTYFKSYPLINRGGQEVTPPKPTHVNVTYNGSTVLLPIASWNQDISFPSNIVVTRSVRLQFIKRTVGGDLELGVAYLTIR